MNKIEKMRKFYVRNFIRYEICAYPSKLTFGGRCVYSTFAWTQTNGITIYSKHISLGKEKQFLGTATVVSDGVLGVTYPAYRKLSKSSNFNIHTSFPLIFKTAKANAYYNVLDTDYENFAVIFSCNNYYGFVYFDSIIFCNLSQ